MKKMKKTEIDHNFLRNSIKSQVSQDFLKELLIMAKKYQALGWEIIPCILVISIEGSYPFSYKHQKRMITADGRWLYTDEKHTHQKYYRPELFNDEAKILIQKYSGFNALALKIPEDLMVIDRDEKGYSNEFLFDIYLKDERVVQDVSQNKGTRYYFKSDIKCENKLADLNIDILSKDMLTYVPPSMIIGAGQYKWVKPPWDGIPVLPKSLESFLSSKPRTVKKQYRMSYKPDINRDRRILEELSKRMPRPDYDTWIRITLGTMSNFGEAAGREIMKEHWPEEISGEYNNIKPKPGGITFGTVGYILKNA